MTLKNEALDILNSIEENVAVCCAITMDPEEVQEMIDKLRTIIENIK